METGRDRAQEVLPVGRPHGGAVGPAADAITWPQEAHPLLDAAAGAGPGGRWVVRGGPGCGRTALLSELVRAALTAGVPADRILVLAHTTAAGVALFEAATSGGVPVAGTEQPVRTVHSLAYGILRLAAARRQAPPPRLLTGAEHDAVLRETLLGEAKDGGSGWPVHIRPALGTVGFARELRDLLLRADERGIGPEELARRGRAVGRPLWVSAGAFFRRHEQQMLLRAGDRVDAEGSPTALNASELVGAALDVLEAEPDLLASVRARHLVAVDDAHHLDPLSSELVVRVGGGATVFVVTEDPDQSVFRFRGAGSRLAAAVEDQGGRTLVLPTGHRMAQRPARVAAAIAGRLPGPSRHRTAAASDAQPEGSATVRRATSAEAEAALVADFLRRRHVVDGIPWAHMAVLARAVSSVSDPLFAAFDAAGVPVVDAGAEIPPVHDPVAGSLLAILRSVVSPPEPDAVLDLLTGPMGGADPVAVRRLRRGVRRASTGGGRATIDVVRDLVLETDASSAPGLTSVELAPIRRLRAVRQAAATALSSGASVEEVLWAAWWESGVQRRLVRASAGTDPWARQADRSLDAVIALFDHAADYVDQVPRGTVAAFCELASARDLPAPRRVGGRSPVDAVSVLSAHSAVGREWEAVAVCGVQDGRWPAPRRRDGLLGVDELVDLVELEQISDMTPAPGERERIAAAEHAAEERRLFLVACSRARVHLLVTAVDAPESGDLVPSRFVDEVRGALGGECTDGEGARPVPAPPVLSIPHLVAELRVAASGEGPRPAHAARLLAGFGVDGVTGADPGTWYGAVDPSASPDDPATPGATPARVVLSPSSFEKLEQCPLRWFLGRLGGDSGAQEPLLRGTVVHLLAQGVAGGIPVTELDRLLARHWPRLSTSRGWFVERDVESLQKGVSALLEWQRSTRERHTLAGVEVAFSYEVPAPPGGPGVTVRGRIDRLERTGEGELWAIDIKTSRTAVTKAEAASHPQLAAYQLATLSGALEVETGQEPRTAGGVLVFPMATGGGAASERPQDPLGPVAAEELRTRLVAAAADEPGPAYAARPGHWCDTCAVRSCCPVVPEGKQVTS